MEKNDEIAKKDAEIVNLRTPININKVYEKLIYLCDLPETSRLINGYLVLRDKNTSLEKSVEKWMQYYETMKGERDACLDELKKRDVEIARLIGIINTECDKCGDCAKFGNDCNAGDSDGNENCRACKKFVSKEVTRLRELVKDLEFNLDAWVYGGRFAITESDLDVLKKAKEVVK